MLLAEPIERTPLRARASNRDVMEAVLFFAAALGALGGAIGVVALRNPFYGVLALIVHLFSLAVLFLLLSSPSSRPPRSSSTRCGHGPLRLVVAYVGGDTESAWDPIPASVPGAAAWRRLFVELSIAVLGSSLLALGTDGPDVSPGFGDPAGNWPPASRVPAGLRGFLDPPVRLLWGPLCSRANGRGASPI